MNQPKAKGGELQLVSAALLWSTSGVCVKYIPWSSLSVSCFRSALAGLLFAVFQRARGQRVFHFTRWNLWGALASSVTGLLCMGALKLTTAANAIVLEYLAPVFVLLYTLLREHRAPTRTEALVTLGVAGGCVLAFADQLSPGRLLGNLLGIASGVAFAAQILILRHPKVEPMPSQLLGHMLTCALTLPFFLTDPALTFSLPILGAALFLGLFQYGLSHIVFGLGVQRTEAVTAGILMTIEPILGPIWVFLILGEVSGPLAIAGFVIVVGAITVYSLLPHWKAGRRKSIS